MGWMTKVREVTSRLSAHIAPMVQDDWIVNVPACCALGDCDCACKYCRHVRQRRAGE